jgi:hypothetical protein
VIRNRPRLNKTMVRNAQQGLERATAMFVGAVRRIDAAWPGSYSRHACDELSKRKAIWLAQLCTGIKIFCAVCLQGSPTCVVVAKQRRRSRSLSREDLNNSKVERRRSNRIATLGLVLIAAWCRRCIESHAATST